jgi:nicotinate-nucleotide--dimethylbenzimidazole phosphoribosyltransferase
MTTDDVNRFLAFGRALGEASDAPLLALGEIGIGNTTIAAALTAVLLDRAAEEVVGLGAGGDAATLDRKRAVVGAACARTRRDQRAEIDPITALGAVGGPEFAVLAGIVLGAAGRGAALVLDGLATGVAALCALRLEPGVAPHLIAGQRSRERCAPIVLAELGCEPLLDLRLRAGEGVGAVLAAGLLAAGLEAHAGTARVDPV